MRPLSPRVLVCGLIVLILHCRRAPNAPERRYALRGQVIAMEPDARRLVVAHADIPGFMPAMTMSYTVKDHHAFDALQPRDSIRADLVVRNMDYWLEHVTRLQ